MAALSRKALEDVLHQKKGIKQGRGNRDSTTVEIRKGTPTVIGKRDPRTAVGLAAIDCSRRTEASRVML